MPILVSESKEQNLCPYAKGRKGWAHSDKLFERLDNSIFVGTIKCIDQVVLAQIKLFIIISSQYLLEIVVDFYDSI